jgi:tricorn protease-like protein
MNTLFINDGGYGVILAICVQTGITTTFAGQYDVQNCVDGPKEKACFEYPISLKLSPDGNTLIVSDDSKLRTICIATGQVDTIDTFDTYIVDFALSPDGKHVIICHLNKFLKYNLETGKSEIILEDEGYFVCELSKDGQVLIISKKCDEEIKVLNLVTNEVIDKITVLFTISKITISINANHLYICDLYKNNIQVLDISKYCTNFKTFLQSQLYKYSFLSRAVVTRSSI